MAKSVLRRLTPQDLIEIQEAVAYDPTVPNGLRWLAKRKGRKPSGIGRTFLIGQASYQATHIVMILNDRWPSAGDSVVTRIDKNGPWGEVGNLKWSALGAQVAGGRQRKQQEFLQSVFGSDVPDLGINLRLASLCKSGHQWMGHPVSLQVKDGPNWRCQECKALKSIKKSQRAPRKTERRWIPELKGLPAAERKLRYRRMLRESLVSQGLTTRGTPLLSPVMQAALLGDEEQRAMLKAIRQSNRCPSVARLVMDQQRQYWKQNPDAKNQHDRQWGKYIYAWRYKCEPSFRRHECQRNSARRVRNSGNHTVKLCRGDIDARFADFNSQCAFCGSSNQLIIEHFIPRSKGGPHAIGNILPACHSCNMSKFNHDPEEWYRSRSYFSETRWRKILRVLGKAKDGIHQLPLL
jgi:5-methylcytosine-specific restriction endonuclease McrA